MGVCCAVELGLRDWCGKGAVDFSPTCAQLVFNVRDHFRFSDKRHKVELLDLLCVRRLVRGIVFFLDMLLMLARPFTCC